MSKVTKQKADNLMLKQIQAPFYFSDKNGHWFKINNSILTIKYTIEVLESIKHQIDEDNYSFILAEQNAILAELESRL